MRTHPSSDWVATVLNVALGIVAVGAVLWFGLFALRVMVPATALNDGAMSGLFFGGAVALAITVLPDAAIRMVSGRRREAAVLAAAIALTSTYLVRLAVGHAQRSDAVYRAASDADLLLVALAWMFIAWWLWRLKRTA